MYWPENYFYLKPTFNSITVLCIHRRTIFISNLPCDFIKVLLVNTRTIFTSNLHCNFITIIFSISRTILTSSIPCHFITFCFLNRRTTFTSLLKGIQILFYLGRISRFSSSSLLYHFKTVLCHRIYLGTNRNIILCFSLVGCQYLLYSN